MREKQGLRGHAAAVPHLVTVGFTGAIRQLKGDLAMRLLPCQGLLLLQQLQQGRFEDQMVWPWLNGMAPHL